jgi:aryl-alcohol dehydrogenase-like predicted oxidoreductase
LHKALDEFAHSKKINTAQLSLAWILAKGENIIPIPGTKKRKYLELNAAAAAIEFTTDEIGEIEAIIARYPNTGNRYPESAMRLVDKD